MKLLRNADLACFVGVMVFGGLTGGFARVFEGFSCKLLIVIGFVCLVRWCEPFHRSRSLRDDKQERQLQKQRQRQLQKQRQIQGFFASLRMTT
jgi:hypothetical protein